MPSIKPGLEDILNKEPDTLFLVNPPEDVLTILPGVVDLESDAPHIRLLADSASIKAILKDFLVASQLANLEEADRCSIRVVEDYDRNSMIVSPVGLTTYTMASDSVVTATRNFDEATRKLLDTVHSEWTGAEGFNIRTPGLSRVRAHMEEEFDPEMVREFDAILSAADELRRHNGGLDEVKVALLAGARREALLYNVSHWGEDVGLASQATFSRIKQLLEDQGMIETSKVQRDIGRPRLRLHLKDSALREMNREQFAEAVTLE